MDPATQRFLELDEGSDVITALQNLGTDPQSNDDDLSFESFVCVVYDKSGKCTSTNKLRWESYVPRAMRERTFRQQEVPSFNISVERGWLR